HLPRSRPGLDQNRGARAGDHPTTVGKLGHNDRHHTARRRAQPAENSGRARGWTMTGPSGELRVDLPVAGRMVAVVGGGVVALGRIAALRAAGADVVV